MLRKLRHDLSKKEGAPLFVRLEVQSLARGGPFFVQTVVDHLFDAVWVDVLNVPLASRLSILLGDASVPRNVKKQLFKKYMDLFRHSKRKTTANAELKGKNVGVTVGVGANLNESTTNTQTFGELTPNDYYALAGELMSFLRESGVEQAVVFGDEANHIKPETELDIIHYSVEEFSKHRVQFVLTMRRDVYESNRNIRQVFSHVSELAPFTRHEDVQELLDRYASCVPCGEPHVPFGPEAAWKIHQITNGMPRQVQALCQKAWDNARADGRHEVTSADLDRAMFALYTLAPR
jgi:hypothetical protein